MCGPARVATRSRVVIEALAATGAGSTLVLIGLVAWLIYKLVRAKDDVLAARDRIEKLDERADRAESDLELENAAHAETRRLLAAEKDVRAQVESQRNQAFITARNDLVERIRKANVADAQVLIRDLLAAPLPGLPQTVPEGRATAPDPDALLDPFVHKPAADS